MIIVFDRVDGFATKVNFVDNNNVVLGYDLSQHCCEDAGYKLSLSSDPESEHNGSLEETLNGDYAFDTEYKVDIYGGDSGGSATFRAYSRDPDLPDVYVHLFNNHNGWYSHGFQFGDNEPERI